MSDWKLLSIQDKRQTMDLIDAIRNELDTKTRQRKRELCELEQKVRTQTEDIRRELHNDFEFVRHQLGALRTSLKRLAVIPIPKDWPMPAFRYGQRVLVKGKGGGTVTGMDYSDGSVIYAGWSYSVVLDEWRSTGKDWSQIFYEDDLTVLGSVPASDEEEAIA